MLSQNQWIKKKNISQIFTKKCIELQTGHVTCWFKTMEELIQDNGEKDFPTENLKFNMASKIL